MGIGHGHGVIRAVKHVGLANGSSRRQLGGWRVYNTIERGVDKFDATKIHYIATFRVTRCLLSDTF
jgi:hypothetical protein